MTAPLSPETPDERLARVRARSETPEQRLARVRGSTSRRDPAFAQAMMSSTDLAADAKAAGVRIPAQPSDPAVARSFQTERITQPDRTAARAIPTPSAPGVVRPDDTPDPAYRAEYTRSALEAASQRDRLPIPDVALRLIEGAEHAGVTSPMRLLGVDRDRPDMSERAERLRELKLAPDTPAGAVAELTGELIGDPLNVALPVAGNVLRARRLAQQAELRGVLTRTDEALASERGVPAQPAPRHGSVIEEPPRFTPEEPLVVKPTETPEARLARVRGETPAPGAPRNEAAVQEGLFGEKTLVGPEQTAILPETAGMPVAKLRPDKIQPEETGRLLEERGRPAAPAGEQPSPFDWMGDEIPGEKRGAGAIAPELRKLKTLTDDELFTEVARVRTAHDAALRRVDTAHIARKPFQAKFEGRAASKGLNIRTQRLEEELQRRGLSLEDAEERLAIEGGEASQYPRAGFADPGTPFSIFGNEKGFLDLKPAAALVRRNFTSRGDLPTEAFAAKIKGHAAIASDEVGIKYTVRDFKRAARKEFGIRGATPAQKEMMDDVLKGAQPITSAPARLQPVLRKMRGEIDALSHRMIDEGVVSGDMATKVADNMGVYATRSYRVFDDPTWAAKIPEAVRVKARNLLVSENPGMVDEEIDGLLHELMYRGEDGPMALLAGAKLGAKDMSSLIRRKDIAPEIRALWGEHRDPLVSYARSMTKMSRLVENHQLLTDLRTAGMGKWLHPKPLKTAEGSFHHQLASESSKVMAPLNGLYTTPEIAAAFETAFTAKDLPDWLRGYMKVNSVVKYSKTVGSLQSQIRNFASNSGFAVAQGHWRVWKSKEALRATLANIGIKDTTKWRDYYAKLTRLGVVQESTYAHELRAVLDDAFQTTDDLTDHLVTRAIKAPLRWAEAGYRMGDDVWKVYAFENELARYKKILPLAEAEKRAAEIVRSTYPTYSMIPEAIQNLRRFPLVGTFVSFPAEIYRTAFHTFTLIGKELADPLTRSIGAQRLAGTMLAITALPAAAIGARHMVGMLKQDDEDMRRFLPPWAQNSLILPLGRGEKFPYIDASFSDPYSYLRKPFMAFLRGDDWHDSLLDAVKEAASPFVSEEILAGKLLDLARNTTKTGSQVYNEADSIEERAKAIAGHLWDALEPGTLTSLKRIGKGITGEVERTGRAYDPELEATALLTGVRISQVDIPQAMQFKARAFSKAGDEAGNILRRTAASRGTVSEVDVRGAYDRSERARSKAFDELRADVSAARRAGMTDRAVRASLESGGLSKKDIREVMGGRYQPYSPTPQYLRDLEPSVPAIRERRRVIREEALRRRPPPVEAVAGPLN